MIGFLLLVQISAANADKLQQTANAQDARSAILCLAFNPNGKLLASGEVDKKIRLWDATVGKQIAVLDGHARQIAALAFSPDGGTLFSASYDKTIRLWDVASGQQKEIQTGDPKKGIPGPEVDDMRSCFNGDGSLLSFGSYARVWDLKAKKLLPHETLIVHGWTAFEPEGRTILSVCGSAKDSSRIRNFDRWDIRAAKTTAQWEGTPGAEYERIALSGDGAWAAVVDVGGDDNKWKIEIWNVATRKRTTTPGFHQSTVNGMAFAKDGSALATASLDKTLKFWDVKSGKELASYAHDQGFMGLAFTADGSKVATADAKGAIQLWGSK